MSGLVLLLLHRGLQNWLAVIDFLAGGVVIVVVAVVELAPVAATPSPRILVIKEPGEALVGWSGGLGAASWGCSWLCSLLSPLRHVTSLPPTVAVIDPTLAFWSRQIQSEHMFSWRSHQLKSNLYWCKFWTQLKTHPRGSHIAAIRTLEVEVPLGLGVSGSWCCGWGSSSSGWKCSLARTCQGRTRSTWNSSSAVYHAWNQHRLVPCTYFWPSLLIYNL